jgi:hypothetical protein
MRGAAAAERWAAIGWRVGRQCVCAGDIEAATAERWREQVHLQKWRSRLERAAGWRRTGANAEGAAERWPCAERVCVGEIEELRPQSGGGNRFTCVKWGSRLERGAGWRERGADAGGTAELGRAQKCGE